MAHPRDELDEDGFIPPSSGSFRIIETRLPVAGEDFPRHRAELEQMFSSEEACLTYLERMRWPRGFTCADCGIKGEPWRSGTGLLGCAYCKALVAVTHGSIFHGSAIPLMRWFRSVWEVTEHEAGTSVVAMQRVLGVRESERAARCLGALRAAMTLPTKRRLRRNVELARVPLEVQTSRGGGRASTCKVNAFLAVAPRGTEIGQLRLRYTPSADGSDALAFARDFIEPGSVIETAPWAGYRPLGLAGYKHKVTPPPMAHTHDAVALPLVHQIASVLKLWLWSSPEVSVDSLAGYLDEFTFRLNRRWYPRGLLFYRLMILSALYESSDEELLGIAVNG